MTRGLPQQTATRTATLPRTDALPQHGQPADRGCMQRTTPDRRPTPRPGH